MSFAFFLFWPLVVLLGEWSAFDSLGFLLMQSVIFRKLISLLALWWIPLLKTVFSSVKCSLYIISALICMYFGHLYKMWLTVSAGTVPSFSVSSLSSQNSQSGVYEYPIFYM